MNRISTLLLLTIAFAACKKEDKTIAPPAANKPVAYLNKTTYFDTTYKRELLLDTFVLDNNGELSRAVHITYNSYYGNPPVLSPDPILLNEFIKDSKGRITEANGYYDIYDYTDLYITVSYQLEYDANGNVSKRSFARNGETTEVTTYAYDNYNRLVKEDVVNKYRPEENIVRAYTYTTPGTLNPATMKVTTAGNPGSTVEYLYTYDNKPNPYTTLPAILYYMGIGTLGTNNILTTAVRDENSTTSYIYRYTADGLPFNRQSNKATEYKYYYTVR